MSNFEIGSAPPPVSNKLIINALKTPLSNFSSCMKTLHSITLHRFQTKTIINMRKAILLFSTIVSFALSALAENTSEVLIDKYQTGHKENSTQVHRSLIPIPTFDVVYDSDTKTIRITSPESQDANVYIYDSNGAVVGYANGLNTTIQLPSAGSYTIYIEGEGWYGIGYIN